MMVNSVALVVFGMMVTVWSSCVWYDGLQYGLVVFGMMVTVWSSRVGMIFNSVV